MITGTKQEIILEAIRKAASLIQEGQSQDKHEAAVHLLTAAAAWAQESL